jgi:F-box and WD-40 domain protein 1/11
MARVFPVDEWSTSQQSQSPNHGDQISADDAFEIPMTSKFRSRLGSLPLGPELDIAAGLQSLSLGSTREPARDDAKRERGIRGLLRKASVSIKSKTQRRHSHAVEDRPSTSYAPWLHRLRGAASFHRHSVFPSADFDYETAVDSCTELMSPIPGYGDAPPIIPHGSGGAAARATAAAQNEYFGRHRQFLSADEHFGDRESGIGIAMSPVESAIYQDTSISRVDFISLLPAELSIQILAHVDHSTLYNTALVSRNWQRVSRSQHVWREAFLREKSKTYAMSTPVKPGSMLGVPPVRPDSDWKEFYRVRQQLEDNWRQGKAEPVYLNGHLDSIYCVQFDE